ncbi:MAG: DedA family protein [Gemmatimonadaceae bacterium]|nr:DedA family protein [Gemmatimonadaceae bacterium]
MTDLLDWLGTLPSLWLYLVISAAAFAENLFPPLPADTAVALGAFVAARGNGSALGAWAATMIGNLGGAVLMYALGRRLGAPWLAKRLPSLGGEAAEARVRAQYARHGLWALAVSRFIPAVRAIVPPLAGALGVGLGRALVAMSLASALWYGLITWFAFTLGANADVLLDTIGRSQRVLGGIALAIAVAAAVYFLRRR